MVRRRSQTIPRGRDTTARGSLRADVECAGVRGESTDVSRGAGGVVQTAEGNPAAGAARVPRGVVHCRGGSTGGRTGAPRRGAGDQLSAAPPAGIRVSSGAAGADAR